MPECSISQKDCIMKQSPAEAFLRKHRCEIIGRTGSPIELADHLLQKNAIREQMYSNIRAQKTDEEKMREIYKYLNSNEAFERVYKWLKEKDPHLIEELENNSDTENWAPERKRSRRQTDEAMDDTDNVNTSDLKNINTIAKLEEWVSDSKNNQRVIDKLKKKIAKNEMEALEMELKTMKMKKCLRFTADDVNKINNDESLQLYLDTTENAEFPLKFTLDMLFEKISSRAPPANVSPLEDSGYGSSCNSSLKSNQSQNTDGSPHTQAQNNDMPLHKSIDTHESAQNHCSTQFVKTNTLPQKSDLKKQNNDLGHEICPNEPIIQLMTSDNDATPTEEDMDIHAGLGVTNRHFDMVAPNAGLFPSSNCAAVLAVVPVQNVILQDKHKSEKFPLTTGNKLHEPPHEPPPAIKHTDSLAYNLGQNEPFIQQQPEINDDIPLDKSTGMQESAENHCLSEFEKTRPLNKTSANNAKSTEKAMDNELGLDETDGHFNTEARNTEQFSYTTLDVVADAPVQNLDLDKLTTENCVLIKVAKSDGSPQTQSVKHTDALAYNLGQNEPFIQQQPEINNDIPLAKSTGMQESDENHCLSGFEKTRPLEKASHKDVTPIEEAMDTEVGLDETNIHFHTETGLQYKHNSESITVKKVAATEKSSRSSVPKHAAVLPGNLGHNKPFIQLQVENDDVPLHKSIGKQESAENHCFSEFEKTRPLDKTSAINAKTTEKAMDNELGLDETDGHFNTEARNTEQFPSSTSAVVPDAPVQNLDLDELKTDNCVLIKVAKTDGSPQTPVVKHTDALAYNLGKNKPFNQQQPETYDDMTLDIFTDKLESAENHCFSEFEKTSPLDKTSHNDVTPTEEAMDTEIGLDEINRHFYSETLNTEQFPSRTSTMVAGAPDQHKSKNIPLTKVAATEESSGSVPKYADVLPGNLGHNKPFIQSQAETDDMPLHKTIGKQESSENDCFAQTDMQPETSYLKNQTNSLDHKICLNEPIIPLKTSENDATLTEEAMDIEVGLHETNRHVDTETLNTEHISSTTSVVVADAPEQNVGLQDKHNSVNCPLNKAIGSDGSPHTSVPEHADVLPGGLEQNKPFLQFQVENNDDTPLTKTMDMQEKVYEPNKLTSVVLKGQTEVQAPISSEPGQSLPSVSGKEQPIFSSTPSKDSKQRKDDRKKPPKKNKHEENKERDRMFKDWAKRNSNSEGGLKKLLDGITIINNAEHHDYPFFTAENVWVYENPEKGEKQILVVTNQKRFSDKIKNLAHYQMLLCGLKKAIIIGQAELNIVLNKSKVPVDLCLKIISEAFIPALAVFKNMQRKKELYSLL